MQNLNNQIPVTILDDVKNYVENRFNEVYVLANNISNNLNTAIQLKQDIINIITQISNKLNASNVEIFSNFGTEYDFEQGINDVIKSVASTNDKFLYILGKIIGSKIKEFLSDEVYVTISNNSDTLTSALILYGTKKIISIDIDYAFIESYSEQITIKNVDKLVIKANQPYVLKAINNNTKPFILIDNCKLVEFRNIEFENSPIVNIQDGIYSNSFLRIQDSVVKFINCTFIPNNETDDYFISTKNSKLIFDNSIFQSSSYNVNIVSSYDSYPSNVYSIRCNIPKSINLINNIDSNIISLTRI